MPIPCTYWPARKAGLRRYSSFLEVWARASGLLISLVLLLQYSLEYWAHVVDGIENLVGGENWDFVLKREDDRVAGSGIQFLDLFRDFIFHFHEYTGEKRAFLHVVNENSGDFSIETLEHAAHQVVGQGPFLLHAVQGHRNSVSHAVVHVDYVRFVFVSEENSAPIYSGHDPFYGNWNDARTHG